MDIQSIIREVSIAAIPLLLAITLHEAAHAYAARYFGDPTAHQAGRTSLNPIRHIDPVGTIMLPLLLLVLGSKFLFGWAKPVPVITSRLRNPKRDMLWVAAAGPFANLLMLLFWVVLGKIIEIIITSSLVSPGSYMFALGAMCIYGIQVNAILMVLNLLPLPPLDGGRIVVSLLPRPYDTQFAKLEPYGLPIILILAITGGLGYIFTPLANSVLSIFF